MANCLPFTSVQILHTGQCRVPNYAKLFFNQHPTNSENRKSNSMILILYEMVLALVLVLYLYDICSVSDTIALFTIK